MEKRNARKPPARYRKIYPRLWAQLRDLMDPGRVLTPAEVVLYVLTGQQTNGLGYYLLSVGRAADDLQTLPQTFRECFDKVAPTFGWKYDERNRVVFIPGWWTWNKPENPNVLRSLLKELVEIPQSPLLEDFAANVETLPPTLHQTFRECLAKRYPKRSGDQEQEQEQEQESSSPAGFVENSPDQPSEVEGGEGEANAKTKSGETEPGEEAGEGKNGKWSPQAWRGFLTSANHAWRIQLEAKREEIHQSEPSIALATLLDVLGGKYRPRTPEIAVSWIVDRLKKKNPPSDGHYEEAKRRLRVAEIGGRE